jgi:hypothetical protein
MKEAFEEVTTAVSSWQDEYGADITAALEAIAVLLEETLGLIRTSANIKTPEGGPIIGSERAVNELNAGATTFDGNAYDLGQWTYNSRGDLNVKYNGKELTGTNFVSFNALLIEELSDIIDQYSSMPEDMQEQYRPVVEAAIKKYFAFRSIADRVYDPSGEKLANPVIPQGFDTGGYTGEWGSEGKIAMLHEKELVLNANDTANFLEALNISRQLIEMIEMNARASSLGLGEMVASTIKDSSQTIEQSVHITAEFPNAVNHSEIEEAFDNLINMASQYAHRN